MPAQTRTRQGSRIKVYRKADQAVSGQRPLRKSYADAKKASGGARDLISNVDEKQLAEPAA